MGIKSTIRGGLAGIKNYVVGPSSNPGPAIDPMIADSEKQLKPVGSVTRRALDNFVVPDSKPPKRFQEPQREDEANPYGIPRPMSKPLPMSKTLKSKPVKKFATEYPKDISKINSAPKPMEQYPSQLYAEKDQADPQGIKRPDIKPNKSMSQYDGKGK